jgi:cobalamin biosynthesis protein CobT
LLTSTGSFHSDKTAQQSYNKPNLSEKDEPIQLSFKKLLDTTNSNVVQDAPTKKKGTNNDNDHSEHNDEINESQSNTESNESETDGNENDINDSESENEDEMDTIDDNDDKNLKKIKNKAQTKRIARTWYKKYM